MSSIGYRWKFARWGIAILSLAALLVCGYYVLGFFALGGLEMGGIKVLKPCEIEVADVRLKSLGVSSAVLEVVLEVKNPNPIAARATSLSYDVFVEGVRAAAGRAPAFEVPAGSSGLVEAELAISYAEASEAIARALERKLVGESVEIEIRGHARVEMPLGSISVPFSSVEYADP